MCELAIDGTVASQVTNLIYQVNGVLPKNIKLEDSLISDLELDSVELIDLLMRLEEIGVTIPESDISTSLTVADIIQRCSKVRNSIGSTSSDHGESDKLLTRKTSSTRA